MVRRTDGRTETGRVGAVRAAQKAACGGGGRRAAEAEAEAAEAEEAATVE
jgi:hypothetical protein